MKTVKPRKRRGIKKDGSYSEDLCPCCYSFGCDPMAMSREFYDKIHTRIAEGKCPSCGQPKEYCVCKSSLGLSRGECIIKTHNNRKMRKKNKQTETA